ncbi:hypothetical protein [Streptomyces sp. BPTC-684]|uniref:hypothetical protein n=1 Tax=Streptomyces sp. BPTC-684 TaxID=3043734 RepID=UPI0024B079E5|nr:hypothetical protein [Streptomyces sp. BPTC-684]WHM41134.1 hypothetical protein QIY60_32605 [Streptomyces sp. BPTC-684]
MQQILDDETLELATRTYDTVLLSEGGSPLGHLRKQADIHQAHTTVAAHYRAMEQAAQAAYVAVDHTVNEFPATLGTLLWDEHWIGYPDPEAAEDANGSAVAHLGDGVWIHHAVTTSSFDDGSSVRWQVSERHTLTLIAPCSCGQGYRTRGVATEDDLLEAVHELTSEPRSIFKHHCPHNCGSVHADS